MTVRVSPWIRAEDFLWREYVEGRRILEESGVRYRFGLTASFERDDLVFRSTAEGMIGRVDYDGRTQEPSSVPVTTDIHYFGGGLSGEVGRAFHPGRGVILEPHLTVGWEGWRRDLKSTYSPIIGPVSGYTEDWETWIARVGVRGEVPVGRFDRPSAIFFDVGGERPFATTNTVRNLPVLAGDVVIHPKGRPWPFASVGFSLGAARLAGNYRGMRFAESPEVEAKDIYGFTRYAYQPESRADMFSVEASWGF